MTDEVELANKYTAWVRGATDTKMGTAIVTSQRVVFFDQKFSTNAAFGVLGALAGALQKRHEEGGPLLEFPVESVSGASREKKLLNKDRVRIATTGGDYLFNDGWGLLGPALRQALDDQGRTVIDQGTDAWVVKPG